MTSRLRLALIAASLLAVPSVASAHIQLVKPTPRVADQSGQKSAQCGSPNYSRAANPSKTTYYKPGETIRVMWTEPVDHKGWFRIAFLQDGENFHVPAASNGPDYDGAAANYPTQDMTGMTDAATGTLILKDRIPDLMDGPQTRMVDVTLPNVECNNCTLQLTQMMLGRGPMSYGVGTYYHFCADLVLSNSPPPVTPPPATPDAGPVDPEPTEPVDGDLKGTCSTGQAGGFGAALLVGLLALVRRRSTRRA